MPQFAFGPRATAHSLHCFTYDREPNPCSGVIVCRVKSLEDAENLIVIFHVKTNAVVPHPQLHLLRSFITSDLNARLRNVCSELNGVVEIVIQRLSETIRIGNDAGAINIHNELYVGS